MRTAFALTLVALLLSAPAGVLSQGTPGAKPGALETMRVDYYHTGNDKEERFSLDRILIEPLPWPGNPAARVDRHGSRQIFLRSRRPRHERSGVLARVRVGLRRMGNDR